jgi:hypothetical protein
MSLIEDYRSPAAGSFRQLRVLNSACMTPPRYYLKTGPRSRFSSLIVI